MIWRERFVVGITTFLRNQQGNSLATFLLSATLLAFVVFWPIEMASHIGQKAVVRHLLDKYLTLAVGQGQLPVDLLGRLQADAAAYKLDPSLIQIGPDTTPLGVPVQWGGSITLEIGYPAGTIATNALIGVQGWDPKAIQWVEATDLSQHVGQ